MKIGNREIGGNNPTYIIAEAGTNHMGDVHNAYELVLDAADAGADAIKFQAFVPDEPLFCPYEGDEARIPYWNKTCLSYGEWSEVAKRCRFSGIHFILSIFQEAALPFLGHCDAAKVASRAAKTYPYDKVELPLIVSDGMMHGLIPDGDNVVVLRCIMKYPTPVSDAIHEARNAALMGNGLSDHSGTPFPGLTAIAGGCPMLEVHFSSEKTGRDAAVELTVDELKLLCDFRNAVAL